jgi:hypothetical protein
MKKNLILKAFAVLMMFILTYSSVNLLNKLSVITGIGTRSVSIYIVVITSTVLVLYLLLIRERKRVKEFSDALNRYCSSIEENKEVETNLNNI